MPAWPAPGGSLAPPAATGPRAGEKTRRAPRGPHLTGTRAPFLHAVESPRRSAPTKHPGPNRHTPPIRFAPPCWREPAALRPHEARQGPPIRRPVPCPTASQALPPRPPPPSSPNEAPACRGVLRPHPTEARLPTPGAAPAPSRPCNPRPAPVSHTRQPSPSAGPRRTVPNAIAFAVPCPPGHGTRIISASYKKSKPGGGSGARRRPEKTTFAGRTACPGVPVPC